MRLIVEVLFTMFWALSLSLTLLFVVARMLAIGLSITPLDVKALLRDRGFVLRALLANVVAVPVLGLILARTLPLPADVALAVLLLAAVPGGVDLLARRERGDTAAYVPAALIGLLSLVAVVVSPAVRLVIDQAEPALTSSYTRLLGVAVLGVVVPLAAGMLVRRAVPAAADVLGRVMVGVAVGLFVLSAAATLVVKGEHVRAVGIRGAGVFLAFLVGAAAVGWWLGGPVKHLRRVLARATATRNAGICLLIAAVSFPHRGVDVAVIAFVIIAVVLRGLVARAATIVSVDGRRGGSYDPRHEPQRPADPVRDLDGAHDPRPGSRARSHPMT
jgi:BASS family bile acid:Na+ symporter